MKIERLDPDGLLLIEPVWRSDPRGTFCETFREDLFAKAAGSIRFVQDNQSLSLQTGTIRGLHYQKSPHGQGKLVRVLRGAILDVAVDARPGSRTFGKHAAVELSQDNGRQLFIPDGFLYGFCTLMPMTEVFYKVTTHYSADHDAGVFWNDPTLRIDWPVTEADAIVSDKDRQAPLFSSIFKGP